MKRILLIVLLFFVKPALGQNYNMTNGTINTCSGNFYDSGGAGGNYGNFQNFTLTFCSNIPGQAIQLNFSAFNIENAFDNLFIYNGPNIGSPLIGSYTGANSPGIVVSSGSCITIRFTSDGSVVSAGWAAAISCVTPTPPSSNYNMTNGAINTCSGNFYDSGGVGGTYNNFQNLTYTICPSTPGAKVAVNFTMFNIENNWDFLTIYNGPNIGSPSLGTYTGTTSPGNVQATPGNVSGCLTFVFTSDGSVVSAGWAAIISCVSPCQTITANLVSTNPAPTAGGIIRICQGQTVNFVGSGNFSSSGSGATYQWSFGNGATANGTNVNYTFNQPGGYLVNLTITDPNGCTSTNLVNQVVQVSTTPTITTSVNPNPICVGQSANLNATVTPTPFVLNCTPPVSGTVFLPDGTGVSYNSPINVNCYSANQTVSAINNIQNICLNLEHSYLGDLNIAIICPNGQSMNLHQFGAGGGTANLGIPWATGAVDMNSNVVTPGTGSLYCFTPTGGFPTMVGGILTNGTFPNGNGPGTYLDSYVPAGNYSSSQPFSNLIGCPLNGTWTIQITDNIGLDNGYSFGWDLNFNPAIQPVNGNFTPTIVSQGWQTATGLTNTSPTQATVTPTTAGNPCYTYSVTDNFGCTYTQIQCLTVNALITPVFNAVGPYCVGATIPALPTTSQNGITGTWSPAINNTTTGTYTFTPTAGQCATTTTLSITITPQITPTFASVGPYCSGATIPALPTTSQNGITGTWSPAINNTTTGTYTFTPTVGQCATTTTLSITITISSVSISCPANQNLQCSNGVPASFISLADFIAAGGSANATNSALVPASFILVSQVSNNQTCPEIITRTYSITNDCGNIATCQHVININDNINPTFAPAPAAITVSCISAVPAMTNLTWTDNCDGTGSVAGIDAALNGGTCGGTITRTWTYADACGNTTTVSQTITVNDNIFPTGNAPANISVSCPTLVPIMDISLVTNVSDNCGIPVVVHVGDVSDNNICNGEIITRTYSITDACGNVTFINQTITITTVTPSVTLSSTSPTTCLGQDGTITISGLTPNEDYNISYNGLLVSFTSNNIGQITINGLSQGNYNNFIIVLSDCDACPQILPDNIVLNDPPSPVINAGSDVVVCFGESVTLTALNPSNAQIVWSGGIQNGIPFVPNLGATVYTVTATLNNCVSEDDVLVMMNPLPIVNAGPDQNVCEGNPLTLTATGAVSYQWNNGVVNGVPFIQTVNQQTYTVIGTDANGCENQDAVIVTLLSNPTPSFVLSDTLSCFSPFDVYINNTTSGSPAICNWNFGNGQTSTNCDGGIATYVNEGCYNVSLIITDINGCINSYTDISAICVSSPPTAAFIANPSTQDVGFPINFINNSDGAITYVWEFGDGTLITQPNAVYEYTEGGYYEVMLIAINEFGCSDTTYQNILIKNPLLFYVPNTFTPGDGGDYNNIFLPVMTSGFDPWDYELTIFNRWGEVIFVSRHPNKGWDGTYGGMNSPDGMYIWQIRVKNADMIHELHRGHINLIR